MPGSPRDTDNFFKSAADALTVATRPESSSERLRALHYLLGRPDARHTGYVAAHEVARSSIDVLDNQTKEVVIDLLARGHDKQLLELRDEAASKSSPFEPLDLLHFAALSTLPAVVEEWIKEIGTTAPSLRLDACQKISTGKKGCLTSVQAAAVGDYLYTKYSEDLIGTSEADLTVLATIQKFLIKHGSIEVFERALKAIKTGVDVGIEIAIWNTVARHGGAELNPQCLELFAAEPMRFMNCLDEGMPKQLSAECRKTLRSLAVSPGTDPEVLAIVVETFSGWFEHLSRSEKMTTTEIFSSLLDRVSESERLGRALADFFMEAPDGKSITSSATQILTPPQKPSQSIWGMVTSALRRSTSSNVGFEGPTSASVEFAVRMLENFDEPFRQHTYEIALAAKNPDGSSWLTHDGAVIIALALGPAENSTRKIIQSVSPNVIPDWHEERFNQFVHFAAGMSVDTSLLLLIPVSSLLSSSNPKRLDLIFTGYFTPQWAKCAGTPSEQKLLIKAMFELADRCTNEYTIAQRILVPFYRQMRSAPFEVRTLLRARYDATHNKANPSKVAAAEMKELIRLLSEEKIAKAL